MARLATDTARSSAKLDPVFARALRNISFGLLAVLALVILIALASYDAYDRSFSYTG